MLVKNKEYEYYDALNNWAVSYRHIRHASLLPLIARLMRWEIEFHYWYDRDTGEYEISVPMHHEDKCDEYLNSIHYNIGITKR